MKRPLSTAECKAFLTDDSKPLFGPNERTIEDRVAGIEALSAHYRSLDIPELPDEAFERSSWYPIEDGPNTKYE